MKIKLSTPAEVRRTLSKIANMLLNNQIDPQRATAITNCCNAVLNCIKGFTNKSVKNYSANLLF